MSDATLLEGFRPLFAEFRGVRLRYFAAGVGRPVVLVHGLGGAATNWTRLAPLLVRSRRVLVPDLPGHGRSGSIGRHADLGAYADCIAAILQQETTAPAALVGHSMGGVVALRLAVAHPARVSALALVESAGISSASRRAEAFLALTGLLKPARHAARLRHHIAPRSFLRALTFGYWGAGLARDLTAEAVLGFLEGGHDATDVAAASAALVRDDPRLELGRVICPALVLWGSRDRMVPLEDGFEYARRLRAPIRVVAGAGHLLIGERPEECASILEDFLDRVGEVDELPLECELLGDPLGQGPNA
jgi:pimeloyl-ACP methyl ester carboxylesterase